MKSNLTDVNFVQKFTKAILKTVEKQHLHITDNPQVISSDMVIKLSNDLMTAISVTQENILKLANIQDKIDPDEKDNIKAAGLKVIEKVNSDVVKSQTQQIQQPIKSQLMQSQKIMMSRSPIPNRLISGRRTIAKYGKIHTLLLDPMISVIQCQGAGQQVSIVKRGTRQITTIILSQEDIQEILEQFSNDSHIPLIDGPFNAQVNDLNISGVNSSMVGSSFVINRVRT